MRSVTKQEWYGMLLGVLLLILTTFLSHYTVALRYSLPPRDFAKQEIQLLNAESSWAYGRHMPLTLIERWEFPLVPLVGPTIAEKLEKLRIELRHQPLRGSALTRIQSLHGIGPKKAKKLCPYFFSQQECSNAPPSVSTNKRIRGAKKKEKEIQRSHKKQQEVLRKKKTKKNMLKKDKRLRQSTNHDKTRNRSGLA